MSIKVMSQVWDSGLRSDLKLVALALADFGNDDGSRIYPSVEYLAWKVGKSGRAVQASLRDLREMGILETVVAGGHGQKTTTQYQLMVCSLPSREGYKGEVVSPNKGDVDDIKGDAHVVSRVTPTSPDPLSDPLDDLLLQQQTRARDLVAQFASFGAVNDLTGMFVSDAIADYGADWVRRAIKVASIGQAGSEKPPWRYVEEILKRWKKQGEPDDERVQETRQPARRGQRGGESRDDFVAAWKRYATYEV